MENSVRCIKLLIVAALIGVLLTAYYTLKCDDAERNMRSFTMPTIPSVITDLDERAEYLATHYWDRFDLGDSVMVHNDSLRGIAMAGYITLLERLHDTTIVNKSLSAVLNRCVAAGGDALTEMRNSLEDYLYDPNSPMRNEELYIPVLRHYLRLESVPEIEKLRSRYQLDMALKNRVGEVAADFNYITADGAKHSMHAIHTPHILLFFNNPDCEDCNRVKRELVTSPHIAAALDDGRLTILAIDVESDIELWRTTTYPKGIINGYDLNHTITKQSLYDLKALPSLYLLNSQKQVQLKDCQDIPQIL